MDVRKFIGTFLKIEDLEAEPLELTIVDVEENDKFDKLDPVFDDGSKASVNSTNGPRLAKAYGYNSEHWIGQQIRLSAGTAPFKGEQVPSIVFTPVSPALSPEQRLPPPKPEIDDSDIPF
jgi:hypothetical protein